MSDEQPLSVLLPIIRRVIPTTIINDIVGVQPMTGSSGITHIHIDEDSNVCISEKVDATSAKQIRENIDAKYSAAKVEYKEHVIHNGGSSIGMYGQIFAMRTRYLGAK